VGCGWAGRGGGGVGEGCLCWRGEIAHGRPASIQEADTLVPLVFRDQYDEVKVAEKCGDKWGFRLGETGERVEVKKRVLIDMLYPHWERGSRSEGNGAG